MSEEKMKVLELLGDQKITAEDAVKLIEALGKQKKDSFAEKSDLASEFEEKFSRLSENMASFAKELGSKINCAAKEVEPKLKKIGEVFVEKTAQAVDEIAKAIHGTVTECNCNDECCTDQCCEDEADTGCCCASDNDNGNDNGAKPIDNEPKEN